MYEIKDILIDNKINDIVLKNSKTNTSAIISLMFGASLKELIFEGVTVITSPELSDYDTSYASAILFPFANRINKGLYTYNKKGFSLDKNEKGEENALHGLIYNKEFKLLQKKITSNYAQIVLGFQQLEKVKGFPYCYTVYLIYTLQNNSFFLDITILNDGSETFPFTLGWHPYFKSSNLKHSSISLQSDKKIKLDKNKIPIGLESIKQLSRIHIGNNNYDDCFLVNDSTVYLETPDYKVKLNTSANENYLQIYTPKESNIIAIEPMTAPGNSFNNKIGLQFLEAGKKYNLSWKICFKNFNNTNSNKQTLCNSLHL